MHLPPLPHKLLVQDVLVVQLLPTVALHLPVEPLKTQAVPGVVVQSLWVVHVWPTVEPLAPGAVTQRPSVQLALQQSLWSKQVLPETTQHLDPGPQTMSAQQWLVPVTSQVL